MDQRNAVGAVFVVLVVVVLVAATLLLSYEGNENIKIQNMKKIQNAFPTFVPCRLVDGAKRW